MHADIQIKKSEHHFYFNMACITLMTTKSDAYGYGIKPLKGCAKHQTCCKIFIGENAGSLFVVKVPSMNVSSPEFEWTAECIQDELRIITEMQGCLNIIHPLQIPGLDGFLVTPACNCTMSKIFTADTFHIITNNQRIHVLRGIANGIAFIASKGYVHGDIKMDNILFYEIVDFTKDEIGTPKIIDFGCTEKVDKIDAEKVLDSDMFTVEYGFGLQAVGVALFITDMLRFYVKVFLNVCGLAIKNGICPEKIAVDGVYGPTRAPNELYDTAMRQLTIVSAIEEIDGVQCIDPFNVPSNIPRFVAKIVGTRIIPIGHQYTALVSKTLNIVVRFPRGNKKQNPDALWSNMIKTISDTSMWQA